MAPQKRLSWEEWQRRANADYVKGEFGVQQMISSWGYPEGMSAETHKIEFDKGKVRQRDRANRRARRAKYNAARATRIGSSRKIVNRAIRDEAAAQWDELVGDRNATIVIGGKPYSFDKYLNKEVRDHSKLTRQKAVEAVNLGKSLGHGTPTTDVGRYAESYTQQFAETPTGNYATQDYIPPDQLERLQKAGLATSPQEAARLHVGTTKIGGRLPDVKIEELLKINPSGNLTRAGLQSVQNVGGYLPIPSNRLMPKAVQSIDPELISQFSRQIGNRINRRLGKSPFDETLDTTSQKYLENIGKYQQFIDLDEASKAALGLYGENVKQYYADLNRQLRSGNTANLTPQQIAINEFLQENLTKAIDVLPSEQRNLYRAIKDPTREGLTNLKVGDVYTDKGFGSFSADEKAALRFIRKDAPSALITVQNAAGTNIGPVMEFDESEFLQKPGAQYRLESIDEVFSPKTGGTVPNYKFTQVTNKPTVTAKGGTKRLISKLGPIGAGLAIGGALLSDNPAEAIPVAAETLTPLGDLQGAPEPAVTMVNVNGKLRPLNTDTNTLMDKPGYGLEQKGGQWREVKRGTGAASRQQSKVQAEQLIPVPKTVMANTPTGVAQLKAMPKSKNIDLINEAQYFIVNPVRSAFDRIFGKRDI